MMRNLHWTVIAVAALFFLVVWGCDDKDPGTTPPTASPAETENVPMLDWKRIADEDRSLFGGEGQQRMLAVADLDDAIVAVGYDGVEGDLDAAIWRSDGGTSWTRVPHDEAIFGGAGDQIMNRVTAFNGAFIAVGNDRATGRADAAIWRSPDGMTWERVGSVEVLGGDGNQDIEAITMFDGRLFAAGSTGQAREEDAAMWTSDDGVAWARVSAESFVAPGAQQILDITASPGRALVAVGFTRADGDRNGALWRSSDGATWERVMTESVVGEGDQNLVSVAAGEGVFVVAGFDERTGESVTIWRSDDGLAWADVDGANRPFSGHFVQSMNGLNATPYGFIALGCDLTDDREDAALWFSQDGTTWVKQLDVDNVFGGGGGQYIEALKLTGGLMVAVGYVSEEDDVDGAAWVAPLPHEAVSRPGMSSLGELRGGR